MKSGNPKPSTRLKEVVHLILPSNISSYATLQNCELSKLEFEWYYLYLHFRVGDFFTNLPLIWRLRGGLFHRDVISVVILTKLVALSFAFILIFATENLVSQINVSFWSLYVLLVAQTYFIRGLLNFYVHIHIVRVFLFLCPGVSFTLETRLLSCSYIYSYNK